METAKAGDPRCDESLNRRSNRRQTNEKGNTRSFSHSSETSTKN